MIDFKTRGKVPKDKVNLLLNAMVSILNDAETKKRLVLFVSGKNESLKTGVLSGATYSAIYEFLRQRADFDLQYDNTHPAYVQKVKKRIIPFIGWTLDADYYVGGCDDTHWTTVKKQVRSQLEKIIIERLQS